MFEKLSRRSFLQGIAASAVASSALAQERVAAAGTPTEWSYSSGKQYPDPFNQVDLDVVVTLPSGEKERVPAFWAGGSTWRVRYAPPAPGEYHIQSVCSDKANKDLHDRASTLKVEPYAGKNPHYQHGVLKIAEDRRHFQHADGTPFFWLGDTWWMGLCKRLSWPDDFQTLAADRLQKGFSVVQIVAGLCSDLQPDMRPADPRYANEAGFPWELDFSRINPGYFDMADVRIQHLADLGIVSCIVGFWGYFIPSMGEAKVKQHWRYLVARWSAYPVVWCLAGEGIMPWFVSKTPDQDVAMQKHILTELARYVRTTDPHHHPITVHPLSTARLCVEDPSVLDFDMLQTGHSSWKSVPDTIEAVQASLEASPKMPVLIGEVCYEGIFESSREEIQRFMFWSSILSGVGGHTYGANGIWQVNTRQHPFGLSPPYGPSAHASSWGGPPWDVAAQLPGSGQIGLGKKLLSRYSWWKLESRPELIDPHWSKGDYRQPFAAEIPGEAIFVFCPISVGEAVALGAAKEPLFRQLQAATYKAFFFNPSDGTEVPIGDITPDQNGVWSGVEFPIFRDWVIVLERKA
jgi:hypothetical protein